MRADRIKKRLAVLSIMIMVAFAASACSTPISDDTEQINPTVMTLKGPTGVSMVKMMEDNTQSAAYQFRIVGSPEEIVAAITSGEADLAAMPTNLASTLYAKTEGNVVMLAINTYGSLFILESGDSLVL